MDVSRLVTDPDAKYNASQFYQKHGSMFPQLASLSKIILCVTATSVPSEALFSITGIIQNDQRNRLQPSTLDSISLIKNNI